MSAGTGRVALVTGGARRIGAAISRALARDRFTVALTYRASRAEARSLAREIGGRAFPLDLLHPQRFFRLVGAIEREFGRLDVLVHNAAVFPRTPAGNVSEREWDGIFAVNLRGPFLLTQAFLPLLRAKPGGAVIFLGDAGAGHLWPGYLPYCLSKLALAHQAAAWKKILAPRVRVGMVTPGFALPPPGFPEAEWRRLRSRGGVRGPDHPDKVSAAVLRFLRREGYNSPRSR
ncbi:MAG: SDR family NAD(P)-dependent oxidoreductase [Candidatus Deferrimicrobiaceae bacterium]